MKILRWVVRALLFVLVLSFSLRNIQTVQLEIVPGYTVQLPLIVLMLLVFITGVVTAWLLLLPSWWKARRAVGCHHLAANGEPSASVPPGATLAQDRPYGI
ncbi:MAG: lipopolysaccharide assembly LapA domain-containing protein [Burkholderiaceae bacterium]